MLGTRAGPTVRGVSIHELVKACVNRRYMVPPLQRPPVWGPRDQRRLLASVLAGRPIGSILLVERIIDQHGGGSAVAVGDRVGLDRGRVAPLDTPAQSPEAIEPEAFVLDGQQRLIALMSGFQSPSHRGRRAEGLDKAPIWCLDLRSVVESLASVEAEYRDTYFAIERSIRRLDPWRRREPTTVAKVAEQCWKEALSASPNRRFYVQLGMLLAADGRFAPATAQILRALIEQYSRAGAVEGNAEIARGVAATVARVREYRVPVCCIEQCTDVEAASTFEQINTTGRDLETSDVACANIFVRDPSLRRLLRQLERDAEGPLAGIESHHLLEACICAGHPSDVPLPELDRRAILNIARDEKQVRHISRGAERVQGAMTFAADVLKSCGVPQFMASPIPSVSVALLAGIARNEDALRLHRVGTDRLVIRRWWWSRTLHAASRGSGKISLRRLMEDWDPAPRQTADTWDGSAWSLVNFGIDPRKVRFGAKAKAMVALLRTLGLRDFLSFESGAVESANLDLHHIFPRAWLEERGRERDGDCFANLTLINNETNRRDIRDKAPGAYVAQIIARLGVADGRRHLSQVLGEHGIDIDLLEAERFDEFLACRSAWFQAQLAELERSLSLTP